MNRWYIEGDCLILVASTLEETESFLEYKDLYISGAGEIELHATLEAMPTDMMDEQ